MVKSLAIAWLIAFVAAACGSAGASATQSNTFGCAAGTSPCGNGCMPSAGSVCCDNGSETTSSYCVNAAGGGCAPNTGRCKSPDGTGPSQFCCALNADLGTADCPSGQHHCGLQCWPLGHPCCPRGSSNTDCPETSWDPVACTLRAPADVPCALCLATSACTSCPADSCCQGDPCAGGGCMPGSVCGGTIAVGDGGTCAGGLLVSTLECDPNGSSGTASYCLSASEYTGATGNPLPAACAPRGTTGCLATTGPHAGALVAPCCPGLTCRVGSACGDGTGVLGGTCLP